MCKMCRPLSFTENRKLFLWFFNQKEVMDCKGSYPPKRSKELVATKGPLRVSFRHLHLCKQNGRWTHSKDNFRLLATTCNVYSHKKTWISCAEGGDCRIVNIKWVFFVFFKNVMQPGHTWSHLVSPGLPCIIFIAGLQFLRSTWPCCCVVFFGEIKWQMGRDCVWHASCFVFMPPCRLPSSALFCFMQTLWVSSLTNKNNADSDTVTEHRGRSKKMTGVDRGQNATTWHSRHECSDS